MSSDRGDRAVSAAAPDFWMLVHEVIVLPACFIHLLMDLFSSFGCETLCPGTAVLNTVEGEVNKVQILKVQDHMTASEKQEREWFRQIYHLFICQLNVGLS